MGSSCSVSKRSEIEQSNIIKLASNNISGIVSKPQTRDIKQDKPKVPDVKFKDFPEYGIYTQHNYLDDEYTGEGIKTLKSYKCNIPYDSLNNLRKQFWEEHRTKLWAVIKSACETDHLSAQEILNNCQL